MWQPARHRRLRDRYYDDVKAELLSFWRGIRSWLHWELSCWQFPLRSAAEIASKWRFYLGFFSFLGITSELFDEFAHWFLNYQPSFYYRTAIPPSILFHSILFPYISFQILFLWILFLMWAIYTYHCLYHFSLNVLLYVCFMYHYFVPCIYMYLYVYMYVYLSIYLLKVGD